MKIDKYVLLVNVGTPRSPRIWDVAKYLLQFLNDKRVINIPSVLRFLLVYFVIIPFKLQRSVQLYRRVWTKDGSPLLYHSQSLCDTLQTQLNGSHKVVLAMRYGEPSIRRVLNEIKQVGCKKLIVIPLFPQYASATTGTVLEEVFSIVQGWNVIPSMKTVSSFFNNKEFITAIAKNVKNYNVNKYEHILFSFHSLPTSHLNKLHSKKKCVECECQTNYKPKFQYCYKAACYETARLIAETLNIPQKNYTVCFQSRMTKNWVQPFTDRILVEKAQKGVKKVLLLAPSFVVDCLETIIELKDEYKKLFIANGGNTLDVVECLNDNTEWIEEIVTEKNTNS